MLQILVRPWSTVVFGKSVDDTPEHDDPRIEPFLTLPASLEPITTGLHHDDQDCGVGLERRSHDIVRQTLTEMSAKAPRLESGDAEHHLDPADDGEALSEHTVDGDECGTNPLLRTPLEMQLEIDAEESLRSEVEDE